MVGDTPPDSVETKLEAAKDVFQESIKAALADFNNVLSSAQVTTQLDSNQVEMYDRLRKEADAYADSFQQQITDQFQTISKMRNDMLSGGSRKGDPADQLPKDHRDSLELLRMKLIGNPRLIPIVHKQIDEILVSIQSHVDQVLDSFNRQPEVDNANGS